jgi:hypothetical protein
LFNYDDLAILSAKGSIPNPSTGTAASISSSVLPYLFFSSSEMPGPSSEIDPAPVTSPDLSNLKGYIALTIAQE